MRTIIKKLFYIVMIWSNLINLAKDKNIYVTAGFLTMFIILYIEEFKTEKQ